MDGLAAGIGAFVAYALLGFIMTLRRIFGFVDYDKADIEALRERLTRAEEQLNAEIRTNALLLQRIDEQAKDLKRFEERWALAWHQLQAKTDELFKTRDELHTVQTENVLLKSELSGLKVQLTDFDKRLNELKMKREEVAEQAEESKRLAILNQGRFDAIPDLLTKLGLDAVIQDWARAAFSATQVPDNGPDTPPPDDNGPGGGGKPDDDKTVPLTDAVSKKKIDKDDKKKAA